MALVRVVLAIGVALAGCGGGSGEARAPSGAPAAAEAPVPPELARAAKKFGMRMLAEGFTWRPIDPKATRFEWSGRSPDGDRELLYSFALSRLDATEKQVLPQMIQATAANLAQGAPCAPVEQQRDFVKLLGVDRVVSVCFEASPFYGKEFHHGIMHGIVNDGALTIVAVLSNDRNAAFVPLPKSIGARGD
ncbi:MAG TPA: hypothetical protein VLT33_46520 [Labilithrix sp.]|nr:hypothetical protein [Labilithrix sp.]